MCHCVINERISIFSVTTRKRQHSASYWYAVQISALKSPKERIYVDKGNAGRRHIGQTDSRFHKGRPIGRIGQMRLWHGLNGFLRAARSQPLGRKEAIPPRSVMTAELSAP